jgi:hypothetical protein
MTSASEIDAYTPPSGSGRVERLASSGWWFHLRRCVDCGHIGCCNSSPSQHARRHVAETGHTVVACFAPGEDWFWDFRTEQMSTVSASSCRFIAPSTSQFRIERLHRPDRR